MSPASDRPITWTAPVSQQLRELPPGRVILLGLGLALAVAMFSWGLLLRPLHSELTELRQDAPAEMPPAPDDDPVLQRLNQNVFTARQQLRQLQQEVDQLLVEREVPVGQDVYMRAIAELDGLIADHGLTLIRHEALPDAEAPRRGPAGATAASRLGSFRQRYQLYGSFAGFYTFLQQLDQFPYLCRFDDLSLTAVQPRGEQPRQTPAVHGEFLFTIYYRSGP